ncbi:glycosyltransferase family 4 protein [Salinarimonas ramus]|uniref:Glycosyl transferase family 1 n=1 Tax=Salinarimonas ramus TaxID=690164 RepID=A0A917QFZ5_9HYPH|nr:glycosyltransferase family 4 protein [Salinarimonas ramus]GGK47124.1 glycosyl transferase family 1 [Salinarimonas ramus]
MRIGVATVYMPGVRGGAEFLVEGLCTAFARAGHRVQRILAPFDYAPASHRSASGLWSGLDLSRYDGAGIDRLVCLKYPTWLARHPDTVVWLLHQHRPAFDLFATPYGFADDEAGRALAGAIRNVDAEALRRIGRIRTLSARVSERLLASTGIVARPLLHPPADAERFEAGPYEPFILAPSRLEGLKRQDLLIDAVAASRICVPVAIVGDGGMRAELERKVAALGLQDRVRFLGSVSRETLLALYARCAGVYFAPVDEDYGYVTLEAMLAARPVVTCRDSGGPLAFVVDGETGFVVEPDARSVAAALESLLERPGLAGALGRAGRSRYDELRLSWDHVVDVLLASDPEAVP